MNTLVAPDRIALFAQPGIGEVVQAISSGQRGRVKFRASFWPAKFYSESLANKPALPLEQVIVVGIDGITLLVTPLNPAQPA
jgi:membrane protein implicated in regulation of membrane protease activity